MMSATVRRELRAFNVALIRVEPRNRVSSPASLTRFFRTWRSAQRIVVHSLPAMMGIAGSRRVVSARRILDFACPRSPRRMKLCG